MFVIKSAYEAGSYGKRVFPKKSGWNYLKITSSVSQYLKSVEVSEKVSGNFSATYFLCRGFCYFNSVAIAARLLRLNLSVERVLIVDWVSTI